MLQISGSNKTELLLDAERQGIVIHEPYKVPDHIRVYITDQSHESQIGKLPSDAIPGFVVTAYIWKKGRKPKLFGSMWNRTMKQAEYIAQEYLREMCTMHECGWG